MVKLSNFEIAFLSYSLTSTKMRKGRTLKENARKIGFAAHFRLLHAPCVLFNPKYPNPLTATVLMMCNLTRMTTFIKAKLCQN